MEWLFPFKASLFPAKSSNALQQTVAAEPAVEEVAADVDSPLDEGPSVSGARHQLRRRSSLSDLDALLNKDRRSEQQQQLHQQRLSRLCERLSTCDDNTKRLGRVYPLLLDGQPHPTNDHYPLSHGGSIGDMMNLKLYGSNRSLVSTTSSIAESVPLETIHRRKTASTSTNSAGRHDSEDLVVSQLLLEDDDFVTAVVAAHRRNNDVVIFEEEEIPSQSHHHVQPMKQQERTPSISERAMRLSLLIQKRQCRCSRYEEEVAVFNDYFI